MRDILQAAGELILAFGAIVLVSLALCSVVGAVVDWLHRNDPKEEE